MRLYNFLFILVIYGIYGQTYNANDKTEFLTGSLTDQSVPQSLGLFPYNCLGDLDFCKNGFTLFFWYKSAQNNADGYLVSSGGQTATSNGFYVRKTREGSYEAGVGKGKLLWTVKFSLSTGSWSNVAISWSELNGLLLYVDGIKVATASTSVVRTFTEMYYDTHTNVTIGAPNNQLSGSSDAKLMMPIGKITHVALELSEAAVADYIESNLGSLITGCSSTSTSASASIPITGSTASLWLYNCRKACAAQGELIAVYKQNQICSCHSTISAIAANTACDPHATVLYNSIWASHYRSVVYKDISLTMKLTSSSATNTFLKGEAAVFFVTNSASFGKINLRYNFEDGSSIESADPAVEHVWFEAGVFTVVVTSSTPNIIGKITCKVNVTDVLTGEKPSNLFLKADLNSLNATNSLETVYTGAYSKYPTTCRLFDDTNTLNTFNITFGAQSKQSYLTHVNKAIHRSQLECHNMFGLVTVIAYTPTYNTPTEFLILEASNALSLSFADCVSDRVTITADTTMALYKDANFLADISQLAAGEHIVDAVFDNSVKIRNKIVYVKHPIHDVAMTASVSSAMVGDVIIFSIYIQQSQDAHVTLMYGDGNIELLYVPFTQQSVTLTKNYSYKNLGEYAAQVWIANELGSVGAKKIISIEKPLNKASLQVTNSSSLQQPVTFKFTVDADAPVRLPWLQLIIDYGNTALESVVLYPINESSSVYVKQYTYDKYGLYTVNATIRNNISSINLPPIIVQVGENITQVDIRVEDYLVTLGEEVVLRIACPNGVPLVFSIDMGDNQVPLSLVHPQSFTVADNFGASSTETASIVSTKYVEENDNVLVFRYKYKSAGVYHVSVEVTNIFSSTNTTLCPDIIVASTAASTSCDKKIVSIANSASIDSPLVIHRADAFKLSAFFTLDCPLMKPGFTWTFEQLTPQLTWKPELQICATNSPSADLNVAGNTLWYGFYRVNLSMVVNAQTANGRLRVTPFNTFADRSTFVRVISSPLTAQINDGKDLLKSTSDIINVNMSASVDPDVAPNNKTGFKFHLFCSRLTNVAGLRLEQMQQRSEVLTSNDDVSFYQAKTDRCFDETANIMAIQHEVVFKADNLTSADNFRLTLFVRKDSRVASQSLQVTLLSSNSSGDYFNSIDELLKKGDTNSALFVIGMITSGLNTGDNSENEDAVNARSKKRGKVIDCLNKVGNQLHNADQLTKTTQVMAEVTSNSAEVSSESKKSAAEGISNVADKAVDLTKNANVGQVKDMASSVLSTAGSILPFAPADTNSSSANETHKARRRRSLLSREEEEIANSTLDCCQITPGLCEWLEPDSPAVDELDRKMAVWNETECAMIYPCDMVKIKKRYKRFLDEKLAYENSVKKGTTQNGMNGVSTIAGILVDKQGGGGSLGLSTATMNLSVANFDSGKPPSVAGDYEVPEGAGGCGAMMMQSQNPFTYSTDPTSVSGNVKTLSLTTCDGKPLKIENSSKPFVLWMEGTQDPIKYKRFMLAAKNGNSTNNTHKVEIATNGSVIYAHFDVQDGEEYEIFLQVNDFPNETYHVWRTSLPNRGRTVPLSKRYVVNPPHNLTELAATYYITVRVAQNRTYIPLNYTYGVYIYATACRYWNDNSSAWDTSGCEVGPLTSPQKTQCFCTHLTSFGGSFAVPPNTIDFKNVFKLEKFLESLPVFSTIIAILILYIVALVWARHMDKKDIKRWGALPLEDNFPSESYHYQLSVYTGMRKNAGTSSKPCFVLSGDDGDTGIRRLEDGKRKTINTGSINNYILSVDNSLGPLTFLRIWHDNSGNGGKRGWFLDQVEVTDLQTGERFFFVCSRWLAVEEDDGAIERIIPVAGKDDMTQFKQLFTHSIRKKFSNDHIWVSVFSRPTKSSFTRVQRISCCVSLLFMTMITNCMFFKASDPNHETSVHIGPIEITLQQIYISVVTTLIILPPSVAIVMIFKKVRPRHNAVEQANLSKKVTGWRSFTPMEGISENASVGRKIKDTLHNVTSFARRSKYQADENEPPKKKKAMTFPWWTIYIGWILVFFMIVAPAFFTILYSMEWGRQKSLDWLQTFFLSFFQSVIVVQPIKVLALAALLSCILKKPDIEEEEDAAANFIASDERPVTEISKKDLEAMKLRRQMSVSANNLPSPVQLKASREQRLHEMEIEAILKECLLYIIFILVLYFISYQDKDSRSFTFVQATRNRYVESGSPSFNDIQTYEDAFTYINNTVIPNLYTTGWYNGNPPQDWRESMQTSDHVSIRLGVGRLRQLRIKENSCTILPKFKQLIQHCRNDYNWLDDDAKSYNMSWSEQLDKASTKAAKKMDMDKHNPWLYRDSIELKSSPYMGLVNTYKGGGYTFNFYCDANKTQYGLARLAANNWLDVRTRALFIEFTVYNANANLFSSVILVIEWLSTGTPVLSHEVRIFRVSSYVGPFGAIIILFQGIYIGFVIYFLVHAINLMRKQRRAYFKSFWNLLEFVTILMSIVTIAMYAMKMIFGATAMDVLKESGSSDYVNFVIISSWVELYSNVLAVVVFLVTIKFIHMLKFNRRLSMLTDTISASIKDMKAFVVTFFLYILAFGFLGYLLFSSKLQSYSKFTTTIETLFQFFIGSFTFSDYQQSNPVLGPLYFFLFVWLVCFGMQTMFLVIIIEAFQAVRKEAMYKRNDYEVGDFIFKKLKGLVGLG